MSDDAKDNATKRLILARRARFVAAALAGVSVTSGALIAGAEACGGATSTELSDRQDTGPQPCLTSASSSSGTPQVCLEPPYEPKDAGSDGDASTDARPLKDAEPLPCLSPPLRDD